VVICLERGADFHMAQLMPLPLTVSCFCKIQIGFTCLVPAHPGSPRHRAVKRGCHRYSALFKLIFYAGLPTFNSFPSMVANISTYLIAGHSLFHGCLPLLPTEAWCRKTMRVEQFAGYSVTDECGNVNFNKLLQ